MPNWSAPCGHPTFHWEHRITILRNATSLKGWTNVWSPDNKPMLSLMRIVQNGSHDEVYTGGSKNIRAAVINHHLQNDETTSHQLSKRQPDNSTFFAAEATAISLALNYYRYMGHLHHNVVVYTDSMCLQTIEVDGTENLFICHIMNLPWLLNDNVTHVRFCSIPSHCGIEGNERLDQRLYPAVGSNQVGCSCP